MIKVEVKTQGETIVSIISVGHAGAGRPGHDLVCAAISGILLGGMRALDENNFNFKEEKGLGSIVSKGVPSLRDAVVLETIATQIECVATTYPKLVSLERK